MDIELLNLDQIILGPKWLNLHFSWKQWGFFLDLGLQKGKCIFSVLLIIHKIWNSFIKRKSPVKTGAGRYKSRDPGGHSWAYGQDPKQGEMVITCFLYRSLQLQALQIFRDPIKTRFWKPLQENSTDTAWLSEPQRADRRIKVTSTTLTFQEWLIILSPHVFIPLNTQLLIQVILWV